MKTEKHAKTLLRSWATFLLGSMLCATTAWCIPDLQLDIEGGTWIAGTASTDETVYDVENPFTLYALVQKSFYEANPTLQYHISAAIVPQTGENVDFGSFIVDEVVYNLANTTYGVPVLWNAPKGTDGTDLPRHSIYETAFAEINFSPNPGYLATAYNSQLNPGGPADNPLPNPDGTMIYVPFTVDIEGMKVGYTLHFDLYVTPANGDVVDFAPFSHDAQSAALVPDGGWTLALLGGALVGVAMLQRKFAA